MANSRGFWLGLVGVVVLAGELLVHPVRAYTPQSPKVQQLIRRAKERLEGQQANMPGGAALVAMALLKTGESPNHEKVQHAVEECRKLAKRVAQQGVGNKCYSETIACMFLCELDANKYRREINWLLDGLLDRQRKNGCWSYKPYTGYDDTSQTQYGVLALWAAHVHGLDVPAERLERVMLWLIRVQDVSGGWVYKSRDPGTAAARRRQSEHDTVTLPMSAAGLGSVYIGAHLLGFSKMAAASLEPNWSQTPGSLPPAVRKAGFVEESTDSIKPVSVSFRAFQEAARLGDTWFARNHTYRFEKWTHYYMYGLERYKAFQELVTGKHELEPKWYNDGVEFLEDTQHEDGSWQSRLPGATDRAVDTAFGVLFLARGTKQSISDSLESGRTRGGKSLPDDLTNIKLEDGQVVDAVASRLTIDELLEELENADGSRVRRDLPQYLTLSGNGQQRSAQVARLRRMVMSGPYQARLTAVKTLGRDRDLDHVPVLIYALSDPDARIKRGARDGLRFISRRFDGFGMPNAPERNQWKAAQAKWKAWFLSIRPDGAIIE